MPAVAKQLDNNVTLDRLLSGGTPVHTKIKACELFHFMFSDGNS